MWMILIAHGDWMANNSFLKKILRRKKFYSCFFSEGGEHMYIHGKKLLIGVRNQGFGNIQ